MNQSTPKFYAMEKSGNNETTIHLYDEVGAFGAGSKEFLADLAKLDGQHIHLRINSPGGSVVEGTAIYNALRRHQGGLTVHIDALAASMASVIAMAGAPVYIADNALLMIHNPWTVSMGDSDQLRREADLLDKLKDNLRNAYVRKTGMESDRIAEMMDSETWLDAVEAVALGFADAIEEGVAAAATATPEILRARFDKFAQGMTQQPEVQEPATPEVIEETAATVVSENADAEQPAVAEIAEEVSTPDNQADEAQPEIAAELPAEVEQPAEPQAKASSVESILEKFNAALAERDAIRAELTDVRAQFDLVKSELAQKNEDLDRLERSLGLSPARVVPSVDQVQDAGSIYDQWKNSTGAEKTRIFRQHRKALEAHAKMHGV
ncbi:MAG: head maturation protease, ClpP-related [Chthoniobacterales bacterium]